MKILLLDIEYREVPGYSGYFVSRSGEIISTKREKPHKLSQYLSHDGYPRVKMANKQVNVHKAVALAWLPVALETVNHRDGNKLNNNVDNLEWVSRRDNLKHALHTGLHALKETPIVGVSFVTGETVHFDCQADATKAGFNQPNINACLKGRRKHHKNFIWRYL